MTNCARWLLSAPSSRYPYDVNGKLNEARACCIWPHSLVLQPSLQRGVLETTTSWVGKSALGFSAST